VITCTCGEPAVVQWRRRPTTAEADTLTNGADPADSTIPVYGCADHALTPDLAALTHQATCSGPAKDGVCDCTPEPLPVEHEFPTAEPADAPRLPPGW